MNSAAAVKKAAINAAKIAREPLETLGSQTLPFVDEIKSELFGSFKSITRQPRSLAQEDLERARAQKKLKEEQEQDDNNSENKAKEVSLILQEYRNFETKQNKEDKDLRGEVTKLHQEIAKLAEMEGIETKVHIQNPTKKVSKIDISFLTSIIRLLKVKAEESKSAKELQSQRQNSKRITGMLAWVSGKQMKVHEQGTLTLQG